MNVSSQQGETGLRGFQLASKRSLSLKEGQLFSTVGRGKQRVIAPRQESRSARPALKKRTESRHESPEFSPDIRTDSGQLLFHNECSESQDRVASEELTFHSTSGKITAVPGGSIRPVP